MENQELKHCIYVVTLLDTNFYFHDSNVDILEVTNDYEKAKETLKKQTKEELENFGLENNVVEGNDEYVCIEATEDRFIEIEIKKIKEKGVIFNDEERTKDCL